MTQFKWNWKQTSMIITTQIKVKFWLPYLDEFQLTPTATPIYLVSLQLRQLYSKEY